jgi:hypothetical protein
MRAQLVETTLTHPAVPTVAPSRSLHLVVLRQRRSWCSLQEEVCCAIVCACQHAQLGVPETAHGPNLEYRYLYQLPHGSSTLTRSQVLEEEHAHISRLCEAFGVRTPVELVAGRYAVVDLGPFVLRYERGWKGKPCRPC